MCVIQELGAIICDFCPIVVTACRTEGAGEYVSVERERNDATTDDLSVLAVRHVRLSAARAYF